MRAAAPAQFPDASSPHAQTEEKRLPNGKLQSEEILKADHEANLKDLDKMKKLVESVQADLTKNKGHVLSLQAVKDLEEVEKIARRVRGRMKRF
jgi:hypothetical protein